MESSFSNLSVTSPISQLIFQPFRRFIYVTVHSPTLSLLHLRHSPFSNPSFASPTSQALHLMHLASRPWKEPLWRASIPGIYRIPNSTTYRQSLHAINGSIAVRRVGNSLCGAPPNKLSITKINQKLWISKQYCKQNYTLATHLKKAPISFSSSYLSYLFLQVFLLILS